jgi:hypothetical protein
MLVEVGWKTGPFFPPMQSGTMKVEGEDRGRECDDVRKPPSRQAAVTCCVALTACTRHFRHIHVVNHKSNIDY